MTHEEELPKAYDPKTTDAKWYQFWEEGDFFKADPHSSKPSYCIVIPPPNVTGVLHMGHALVNTLQDILIRWKRMQGFEALWVPGTDHAGIATQTVVERHLMKTEGKKRIDFPRDEFVKIVWEWKAKHEHIIINQLKKLGSSCDWSRLRFTMDEGCNKAVRTVFHKLYSEGLIYRGDYLVNWDPITETALADDEVEYEDRDSYLWYFKYPLVESSGHIVVATTRPETMLGDTAVAVSPQDPRYKHLIGTHVRLPLMDRVIPIIADHHVDPNFGTGVVKITPAHDPNDYKMGLEHKLPFINILTPNGRINENGGPFEGLPREEARENVVKAMQDLHLVEKIERHQLRVGVSYRSKAIIEPYLSKQWFVKMGPFVEKLKSMVNEKNVKVLPPEWESTYFHWVNNLRDWCISRQLWWGHRIPVWYHKDHPEKMICYAGEGLPPEVAQDPDLWEQDSDVLDTWFSSALWPFSTLGWPEKTPDLSKFYPNAVLVTGHDILFFWVARMMLMGEYVFNQPPFPEVFLHGLIYGKSYWRESKEGGIHYITGEEKKEYDLGKPLPPQVHSKWEKLSKSKGNVIDPLEMIEDYGTDAVRMSLCASANQSPHIDLDRRRFEEFKNFANKLWNGARFVFLNLHDLTPQELAKGLSNDLLKLEDLWILSLLNRRNEEMNAALSRYDFETAATTAYNFFWNEFCAYYLEIVKPILFGKSGTPEERKSKQKVLVHVLCNAIRLLHPIAPFITEELFQKLKTKFLGADTHGEKDPYTQATLEALAAPSCAVASYPKVLSKDDMQEEIEKDFGVIEKIIYTLRNIRGEMKIPPGMATDVYVIGHSDLVANNLSLITALVKINHIEMTSQMPSLSFCATGVVGNLTLLVPLPQELQEKEKARLMKEKERLSTLIENLNKQLANPDFIQKAKPELVEKQKLSLSQAEHELKGILEKL